MSTQHALLTILHDQLGQVLTTVFASGGTSPFVIRVNPGDGLLAQLQAPGDDPPRVSLGFGLDILTTSVSVLLGALPTSSTGPLILLDKLDVSQLVDKLRNALGGRLGLFEQQRDAIANLIAARDPAGLRDAVRALFQQVSGGITGSSTKDSVSRLQQFIGNDLGTALPFTTMIGALQQGLGNVAGVPESVERALLDYFFRPEGYKTLDGESLASPVHLSDVGSGIATATSAGSPAAGLQALKGLLSTPTAERYIRDLTRVIVDSAYDVARGLGDRDGTKGLYGGVVSRLSNQKKFVAWYRGFASMAESVAIRAVEVGTQGVSQFQTNPLIAAAAGSFAGSVARKFAEDSFLTMVRKELGS